MAFTFHFITNVVCVNIRPILTDSKFKLVVGHRVCQGIFALRIGLGTNSLSFTGHRCVAFRFRVGHGVPFGSFGDS